MAQEKIGVTKAIKTMFIRAIRQGLLSNNLANNDPVIAKVRDNVSAEYPMSSTAYPSIWVTTAVNSLNWNSMNSELVDIYGNRYNTGEFFARINMEPMALSNEERDSLVDALVNMIMFGQIEDDSNLFVKYLIEEEFLNITPKLSEMSLSLESVTIGTPWDENQVVYTRSLSFETYGEFAQRLDNGELIMLRDIELEVL